MALAAACSGGPGPLPSVSAPNTVRLISPSFADGGAIPERFTCDGENVHPVLVWSPVPGAAEYVLTMVDVDANNFVHWMLYEISGMASGLPPGRLPSGAVEGKNSFGHQGYDGPCPPGGSPHRYVFTLYRLSAVRSQALRPDMPVADLVDSISCCVQATGTLTGTYQRA